MVANGISGLFFSQPMRGMEQMVQQGILTLYWSDRWIPWFLRWLAAQFFFDCQPDIRHRCVILCFTHLAIHLTILKIVFLFVAIIGSALIQAAILVTVGTMSFWVVKNTATYSLLNSLNNFLDYPITIYNKSIQAILTFVVPVAFVNFYPAHYFLDKTGDNLFFPILQYGTPVVGLVLFSWLINSGKSAWISMRARGLNSIFINHI